VRIVIWHGYLLGGTGSNVYIREIARKLCQLGHDVTIVCQEPHPDQFDVGDARILRWELKGSLPVFVLDQYEDVEPLLLSHMSVVEREAFVESAAAAVAQLPCDFLITNHVLLGAPVGAATGLPFATVAHGSELEYSMRDNPDLCEWARRSLNQASAVIAVSEEVAERLRQIVGRGRYEDRVHVVPAGVDTVRFVPEDPKQALESLLEQCRLDQPNPDRRDVRRPDDGNEERLRSFLSGPGPTVVYVGKICREKGVPLLFEALSSVDVRCVIVGFGPMRAELEQIATDRVLFTGPLEHRHLAHLWPLSDVSVVPSVFPEAFGMVAAEAAATGSIPLVANQSGLAEVARKLEERYPPPLRNLATFRSGDRADLSAKLQALLSLPTAERHLLKAAARATAVECWSLDSVASRLLAVIERSGPRGSA
jgi:glycosyltransferase involved in cell wall biosynthesis